MASALKGLQGVLSKKATAVPPAELPADDVPHERSVGRGGRPSKDSRVQIMVRMFPDERKALRQIALDSDTTVQELIEDVVRDVIRRHQGGPRVRPEGSRATGRPDVSESGQEADDGDGAPGEPTGPASPPAGPLDTSATMPPGVRWPKGTTPEQAEAIVNLVRERRPTMSSRKVADAIKTEIGVKLSHEGVESIARSQGVETGRRRT